MAKQAVAAFDPVFRLLLSSFNSAFRHSAFSIILIA
jgi:hypothetical protein